MASSVHMFTCEKYGPTPGNATALRTTHYATQIWTLQMERFLEGARRCDEDLRLSCLGARARDLRLQQQHPPKRGEVVVQLPGHRPHGALVLSGSKVSRSPNPLLRAVD